MSHLDSRWVAKWQELGLPAPKEQDLADTVVEAESEDESEDDESEDEPIVEDDSDLLEAQRKGLEGMTIGPKEYDQGSASSASSAVTSAAKKDVPLPPTPPRTSPPFRPASVDDDDDDKMDEGGL